MNWQPYCCWKISFFIVAQLRRFSVEQCSECLCASFKAFFVTDKCFLLFLLHYSSLGSDFRIFFLSSQSRLDPAGVLTVTCFTLRSLLSLQSLLFFRLDLSGQRYLLLLEQMIRVALQSVNRFYYKKKRDPTGNRLSGLL